jgi:hypothetical protein
VVNVQDPGEENGATGACTAFMCVAPMVEIRVGQNRIYTPYMTVYLVISLPKLPYIHRIYMVLANPSRNRRPRRSAVYNCNCNRASDFIRTKVPVACVAVSGSVILHGTKMRLCLVA